MLVEVGFAGQGWKCSGTTLQSWFMTLECTEGLWLVRSEMVTLVSVAALGRGVTLHCALGPLHTLMDELLSLPTQDTHRGLFVQQLRPTQNLQPRIKLKLFGHSGAGKTTLVESLKCGLLRSFFRRRRPRLSSTNSVRFPPSPLASKPAGRSPRPAVSRRRGYFPLCLGLHLSRSQTVPHSARRASLTQSPTRVCCTKGVSASLSFAVCSALDCVCQAQHRAETGRGRDHPSAAPWIAAYTQSQDTQAVPRGSISGACSALPVRKPPLWAGTGSAVLASWESYLSGTAEEGGDLF